MAKTYNEKPTADWNVRDFTDYLIEDLAQIKNAIPEEMTLPLKECPLDQKRTSRPLVIK